MKKLYWPSISLMFMALLFFALQGTCLADAKISAESIKAGDPLTIEGAIEPGQELYIAIAQQDMFASKDTTGTFEKKKLPEYGERQGLVKTLRSRHCIIW